MEMNVVEAVLFSLIKHLCFNPLKQDMTLLLMLKRQGILAGQMFIKLQIRHSQM
jgi:hypothetical protein